MAITDDSRILILTCRTKFLISSLNILKALHKHYLYEQVQSTNADSGGRGGEQLEQENTICYQTPLFLHVPHPRFSS